MSDSIFKSFFKYVYIIKIFTSTASAASAVKKWVNLTEEYIIKLKLRKRIQKLLKLSVSVKSSSESLFNLSISIELNYETIETKHISIKIDKMNWFKIYRKEKTIAEIFLNKNRL